MISKTKTKLLLLFWVVTILLFFVLQPDIVLAATEKWWESDGIQETVEILHKFLQWLYAATWPLLVIAGKFMSNEVIYGEPFGLDKILWWMWNMIRSMANYFMGFIFLISIFLYVFHAKDTKMSPMKLLPQIVVAALLVNSSWFIIWALLDLSTILTFGVWTIPMKIWSDNNKNESAEVNIPEIKINFSSDNKYSMEVKVNWQDVCMFQDGIVRNAPCVAFAWWCYKNYEDGEKLWNTTSSCVGGGTKISDMLKRMGDMTGPLVAIYASFIDSSSVVVNSQQRTAGSMFAIAIVKLWFLLALIVPLVLVAAIFIMRALVLWVIIPLSPLIFLFTALTDFNKFLTEKQKIWQVITLIFMPVIVVFALSLSFVFMSGITMSSKHMPENHQNPSCSWNDGALACHVWLMSIWDWNKMQIKIPWVEKAILFNYSPPAWSSGSGGDLWNLLLFFSRIIWSIFGIVFMWAIVKAAMKQSAITSSISEWGFKFAQDLIKSAPVFPGGYGIKALQEWVWMVARIPKEKSKQQFDNIIKPKMQEIWGKIHGEERKKLAEATTSAVALWDKNISENTIALKWKIDTNFAEKEEIWGDKKSIWEIPIWELVKSENKEVMKNIENKLKIKKWKLKEVLEEKIKDETNKTKPLSVFKSDIESIYDDIITNPKEETRKELKTFFEKHTWKLTFPEIWNKQSDDTKNKMWVHFKNAFDVDVSKVPTELSIEYWKSDDWKKFIRWLKEMYPNDTKQIVSIVAQKKIWNEVDPKDTKEAKIIIKEAWS